nr:hypothetical protein [Tanacetum cinerariifolium]
RSTLARDAEIARIHAEEELQIMIDRLGRSNKILEDFIPMGSKEEAERLKRKGLSVEQESVKKLMTSEEVPEEAKSPDEVPEEKQCNLLSSGFSFLLAVVTFFTGSGNCFWQWELYTWQ